MKRLLLGLVLIAAPARAEAPLAHASATCTPANKPGRIRCRAVLELPLSATNRIAWSELRVASSDPSVTPLRGRLGPLDAETRDESRVVWSFSVAAADVGDRSMRVRMLATLEPKSGGAPVLFDHAVDVPLRVTP